MATEVDKGAMRNTIITAILFLLSSTYCYAGQPGCRLQSPLKQVVASFDSAGKDAVTTLVELGRQTHTCFALPYLNARALRIPVAVHERNTSVETLINRIFRKCCAYAVSEHGGIVTVNLRNNKGSGTNVLLNHEVPEFDLSRTWLASAENALRMRIQLDLNPRITGFAGTFPTRDRNDTVGPMAVSKVRVSEILDDLVRQSKGATWVVAGSWRDRKAFPDFGVWRMLEYSLANDTVAVELQSVRERFPEQ